MNWWIIEDCLCDSRGHWFEYIQTFRDGLEEAGDCCKIFADQSAEPWLLEALGASPALPNSIWARMSDGAPKWKRLLRIPSHGWATYRAISCLLKANKKEKTLEEPDLIFVPTVSIHHLLAWWPLIQGPLKRTSTTKVLLFFPNTPLFLDEDGRAQLNPDPSAQLFKWLIRKLAPHVESKRVILGAETEPMVEALTELIGVNFTYFPHPVQLNQRTSSFRETDRTARPLFAAYGAARHEKGSDLLQTAIRRFLEKQTHTKAAFKLQWLGDFKDEKGQTLSKDPWLEKQVNFEFITDYFKEGSYMKQVARTDVMLLPYRASYSLRVSRVVIEAMIMGIPVITTQGTTLHQQAEAFGAVVSCQPNSVESLTEAIEHTVNNLDSLQDMAGQRAESAREHFSVNHFRQLILKMNEESKG